MAVPRHRLRESHLFQLRLESRQEPLAPLMAVLANLGPGETALYQVLFQPVQHPWTENILTVAGDPRDRGKSIFADLPDLPRRARAKVERPLFAVAVRLAAGGLAPLARLQAALLSQLEGPDNGLVAMGPTYPVDAVLGRYTHSAGMLLSLPELAALAHLPDPALLSQGLQAAEKTAPAPPLATNRILCPLGINGHRGKDTAVGISGEQLTRHVAILGGTGAGKTNLMKVAFAPLMDQGYGLAVLDPKGDLAQGMLDLVPAHRVSDVVWFDPSDRQHPPAFNVLQSSRELSPEALASELMTGLKRLFTGVSEFGTRMEWLLRTAVRTLLASAGEKTLLDVGRFLEEPAFRSRVLESVDDGRLRQFWQGRNLTHNVIDPLLNRLSAFLDRPTIRDVVGQPNRIDLPQILREGKIFIANLEKGLLQDAAYVLGSFILSRLQLAALSRPVQGRRLFPVLVDEFHVYAGHGMDTEGIETFLSETRSYQAPLVVSTQYLGRLNRGVVAALFGNLGTQVCMSMGQIDAQMLQRELGRFTAEDLLNLGTGQAIVRMGSARDTLNVRVPLAGQGASHREEIIRLSRARYCRPAGQRSTLRAEGVADPKDEPAGAPPPVWIADQRGNVFRREQLSQWAAMTPQAGAVVDSPPAGGATAVPSGEEAQQTAPEPQPALDRELLAYLEHAASHPFASALTRDQELGLSRYKGGLLRQRLVAAGWVRLHKAGTGKRSGQLLLLEVTEEGYELLASLRVRAQRPRGRGGFLHRYYAFKIKQYAQATWPGWTAAVEDGSQGRPADVTVRSPEQPFQTIAFEIFVTGEAKEVRGIGRDVALFDRVMVCALNAGALESLQARASEILGAEALAKVEFHLITQFLLLESPAVGQSGGRVDSNATTRPLAEGPAKTDI